MPASDPESPASRGQVVGKTALLIVVVGATGMGLLAERQRRFEAAHAMTMAHRQADALEREIRKLRAEIADRVTPNHLDSRIQAARVDDPLEPILWARAGEQEPAR